MTTGSWGAALSNRDASTTQLNVGYRGSALARDDREEDAPLRAGDRAPDATKLTTVEGDGYIALISDAGDVSAVVALIQHWPRRRYARLQDNRRQ
ncbi:hypothetical protein ACGFH8_17715 [Micromonospora sp. NPDC049175]|uniref:hypothetical protein n=1 Tax=Micromonospora sp. NPDC049175 TaxID=3364266 RepID=UPI00371A97C6